MLDTDNSKNSSNKEWNNYRKKVKIIEICFIIATIILIIIGALFDTKIKNDIILFPVNEFSSYILNILGIQATVSTLTIALVALISNNISETYMGIAVSDYYLNIRPFIFKQDRIICISLFLIALGCAAYALSCYNIVISIFIITILLVLLSSYEIYFLFRGLQKAQEEIELYVSENISLLAIDKKSYQTKSKILSNFVNDWTHICNKQTQQEYNTYKNILLNAVKAYLLFNTQECLSKLKDNCAKLINSFLYDDSNRINARGVELLINVYDCVWHYVVADDFKPKYTSGFNLFNEIDYGIDNALKNMPLQLIEKTFSWEYLTDMVTRTTFCIEQAEDNLDRSPDLQASLRFSAAIGSIVKYKEQYNKEYIEDLIACWGRHLSNPHLNSSYKVSEERKKKYLNLKCRNYFYYCKGFIDNEYMNLIKEQIFFRAISNLYYRVDNSEILYYLAIDCYLYYLSEKESEECVDTTLKTAAKQLLEDKKVIMLNDYLLSIIERSVLKYSDLENDLQQMLQGCERFPMYSNSKTMIMDNVVREFYVFTQLIMNNNYRYHEEKEFKLTEQPFVYANQFLEGNEEHTKENLKRFYMLFQRNTKSIDDEVSEMYAYLENHIKQALKDKEIKEAEHEQKKYLETINEIEVINKTQEKIGEYLKSIVNELKVQPQDTNIKWTSTFNLLNCNLFTETVNDNIAKDIQSDICASLVLNIIHELLNRKLLDKVSRTQFKDDNDYLDYMKNKSIKTLIGSEYIFKNSDYKNQEMFKEYYKELKCIFYGYYQYGGVALKENSIQINIKNVKISIRPVSLSDVEYTLDESGNLISYNVTNNIIIPFHKDEFMVYINNKRKLLNISIEVEIIAQKNDIGIYLIRNNE